MKKTIIELKNVWKTYQMGKIQVHAVCGINLAIKSGEFLAIQGPSGSGKSTTMNLIGCLDMPSRGTILLDSHDISKMAESELAQIRGKKIGFIFQQFNLIPTLTALQNVTLPMIFQGISREKREQKGKMLLEMVELSDRMSHKPNELSGGEQQRVAIARSLVNDPEIVLADEPTGNLDTKTGETVISFLDKLNKKEKKTIVMVTHDKNVAKHAERIELLKDGKIVGG